MSDGFFKIWRKEPANFMPACNKNPPINLPIKPLMIKNLVVLLI